MKVLLSPVFNWVHTELGEESLLDFEVLPEIGRIINLSRIPCYEDSCDYRHNFVVAYIDYVWSDELNQIVPKVCCISAEGHTPGEIDDYIKMMNCYDLTRQTSDDSYADKY